MAIKTKSDIQIENKSYTNKDFSQIYPELLDLVKKLTNKWDPETTNESDPGLVLLKLLAFIADKNNYNIDKNILEQFMPSVTQETNMRKLCEMMGYNIGYYKSAIVNISFSYLGGNETLDKALGINQEENSSDDSSANNISSTGVFHIKAFDTSFKTEDNIVYTLLEDIEITADKLNDPVSKKAIQGQLKSLNLNEGSITSSEATKIQLYNLDDNNRVYFSDKMVAENGIFINKEIYDKNLNPDAWRKVDNLNDQELGSKIFKFGFDSSKNLPYIEFPSDIAELIGDGLEIYYIISDGVNGNVSPNTITTFNSYSFDVDGITEIDNSCYSLKNNTSISAAQPETIDEVYKNFKKTVGTFNTLVSCKDYSNYIYTYEDEETNKHLVSNVQAMDLRTDPNKSFSLLYRDSNGSTYYKTILKDISENSNTLILHGTTPNNYTIINKQGYEQTYTLLSDSEINDIESALNDIKTLSHILTRPKDEDISFIEQRYSLNINISTKYKVNSYEQSSILSNVTKALYNNFNAREVEFGEELVYDEIVKVIENADERIKLAVVDDPIINPYIITGNSQSKKAHLFNPNSENNKEDSKIILENILGGRIQLYIKNEDLIFDYNMDISTLSLHNNLAAIKTNLTIAIPQDDSSNQNYTLKKNENVQIIEDSYISTVTYPAYVYYGMNKSITTQKGVPYKLKENEILYIYYTDTNDVKKVEKYEKGTIIRTNSFALPQGESTTPSRWLTLENEILTQDNGNEKNIKLYSLGTNETIEILKLNETILNKVDTRCFWYSRPMIGEKDIINQESNCLVFYKDPSSNNIYYHILEEDELFIYPSDDNMTLFSLGSGTKIQVIIQDSSKLSPFIDGKDKYGENTLYLEQNNKLYSEGNNTIDLNQLQEAVNSEDVSNFENTFSWNYYNFKSNPIHIVETSLTTYIEGDNIASKNGSITLSSSWSNIEKETLKTSVGEQIIGDITNAKIRSILTFNGNSSQPQKLLANQVINLYYYNNDWIDSDGYYDSKKENSSDKWIKVNLKGDQFIQLNADIDSYNDIILRSFHYEENEEFALLKFNGRYEIPYSCVIYNENNINSVSSDKKDIYKLISEKNIQPSALRNEYKFKWNELKETLDNNILIIKGPLNIDNLYINVFDQITEETHLFNIEKDTDGSYNFKLDLSYINNKAQDNDDRYVLISKPILLDINPLLDKQLNEIVLKNIISQISKTSANKFDYLAPLNTSKLISNYDLINSFFDYNNVYNKLTIAKIDFGKDKFNCNIVTSSRK